MASSSLLVALLFCSCSLKVSGKDAQCQGDVGTNNLQGDDNILLQSKVAISKALDDANPPTDEGGDLVPKCEVKIGTKGKKSPYPPGFRGKKIRICTGRYADDESQTYTIMRLDGDVKRPLVVNTQTGFAQYPEYVFASLQLRPKASWDTFLTKKDDMISFLMFVCISKYADTFGVDCGRIALVGYSAGGMTSQLVGQELRKATGIKAVVTLNGHLSADDGNANLRFENADKSDCPSYLMFVGKKDENFQNKKRSLVPYLEANNIDYELHELPGVSHGSGMKRVKGFLYETTKAFLARHLAS